MYIPLVIRIATPTLEGIDTFQCMFSHCMPFQFVLFILEEWWVGCIDPIQFHFELLNLFYTYKAPNNIAVDFFCCRYLGFFTCVCITLNLS